VERIRVALPSRGGLLCEILEGALALDGRTDVVSTSDPIDRGADVVVVEASHDMDDVRSASCRCHVLAVDVRGRRLILFEMRPLGTAENAAQLGRAIQRLAGEPLPKLPVLTRLRSAMRLVLTGCE
jgi:hypothetical protein